MYIYLVSTYYSFIHFYLEMDTCRTYDNKVFVSTVLWKISNLS